MMVETPPARFFNRELSWLRFNQRVLEEALDVRLPVTERARFLAIVAGNLDEFVMVRLAELLQNQDKPGQDAEGRSRRDQLDAVRAALVEQVEQQYAGFTELLPLMRNFGLNLVKPEDCGHDEQLAMQAYFRQTLEPVLTPLAVGSTSPPPLIGNLKLYLALEVQPEEADPVDPLEPNNVEAGGAATEGVLYALVGVPSNERRLVPIGNGRFVTIEALLLHFAHELFPGYAVKAHATFRITRDGLFDIDEDHAPDLLSEIEEGLRLRGRGVVVRFEVDNQAPGHLIHWLLEAVEADLEDVVRVPGPLDLTFLASIASLSGELQSRQFEPHEPLECPVDWEDPFTAMRQGSVLLHHPYESFRPVVELLEAAAQDPKVVAIKQTLYRVSGDSPVVHALVAAAEAGKQVTVLCELKARFDERSNIEWARRLEHAGAHVLYGVIGYKVHTKLLLIIRRDEDGIRRYSHVGTGNYNDKTARLYEDFSYLTTDDAVCHDVSKLFNMLTGFLKPPTWERLLVAPHTFRKQMQAWINREARHAKAGKPARIFAKLNNLVDHEICEHLYQASQAGVRIDLVVRGICVLRPRVVGLSENIRVRSVIGRFLEHSRFYFFQNDTKPVYVIGSGDLMTRNLDRRVESLVEIREPELRTSFNQLMEAYLADRRSTRELQPDGSYLHLGRDSDAGTALQELLIQRYKAARATDRTAAEQRALIPARKPRPEDAYG